MDENDFDINTITVVPALAMSAVSLLLSIAINEYVLEGRGRITFFAVLMSLISIYTARNLIKYTPVIVFLVVYIICHIVLVALPFTRDSSYSGPILLPFAIADYVAMVFSLRKWTLWYAR